MRAAAAASRARGLSDTSSTPACLGVPEAPGPSPSMASTPSMMLSRGLTYSARSSSTSANCSWLGWVAW